MWCCLHTAGYRRTLDRDTNHAQAFNQETCIRL